MGEGKCSPGPWKAIENSWQYTTIYDAHDHEICRLDLERFEDLNEETQDKYEAIQRADAAAIVRACDHLAALRRAKAEGMKEGAVYNCMYCNGNACGWERTVTGPNSAGNYLHRQVGHEDREVMCMSSSIWVLINWNARAAQIEADYE